MLHNQIQENDPQLKLREKQTSNTIYLGNIVSPVALETNTWQVVYQ